MRITLVNQAFYPDVVASGQHLADLALELAARGHQVTVLTSQRAYDDPSKIFSKRESWRGIEIRRLFATGFGKGAKWRRALDFASFIASCCWAFLTLPRQDLVLAMTSPPLISFFAAVFSRVKKTKFCYWVMDLNPDEAIAAGWLRENSVAARFMERCSRFSLSHASNVVVLDVFMRRRILDKGIAPERIAVIPPWPHESTIRFDPPGRERFRKAHGLEGKFVVMYSGNHSPCHPLDTVLAAAAKLADNEQFAFCFVGGGSEFKRVKQFAQEKGLRNIICLPYQPWNELAGSLSAADAHLVVMGDPFVGLVHPCKVYNIMRIGTPLLYIGPETSHVTQILNQAYSTEFYRCSRHGEADRFVTQIVELQTNVYPPNKEFDSVLPPAFSKEKLTKTMIQLLEELGCSPKSIA